MARFLVAIFLLYSCEGFCFTPAHCPHENQVVVDQMDWWPTITRAVLIGGSIGSFAIASNFGNKEDKDWDKSSLIMIAATSGFIVQALSTSNCSAVAVDSKTKAVNYLKTEENIKRSVDFNFLFGMLFVQVPLYIGVYKDEYRQQLRAVIVGEAIAYGLFRWQWNFEEPPKVSIQPYFDEEQFGLALGYKW